MEVLPIKKRLIILLAILLCLAPLAACTKREEPTPPSSSTGSSDSSFVSSFDAPPSEVTFPAPIDAPLQRVDSDTPALYPILHTALVGFLDQNFQMLIEPRYLSCTPASDGKDTTVIKYYAAARTDGWVDVLDLTGKVLDSYEGDVHSIGYYVDYAGYYDEETSSAHDGVVYADEGDSTTVITKDGSFTLPFRFSAYEKLSNGYLIGSTYTETDFSYSHQNLIISDRGKVLARSTKPIRVYGDYIWLTKGAVQGYVDLDGNWYYRESVYQMLED